MTLVDEVLETWHDAESLLDELPPLDPDHKTVLLAIDSLRSTYQRLMLGDTVRTSHAILAQSRETVDRARELLDRVRTR